MSKRKTQEEFGNSHGCSLLFYVMLLLLTIVKMTLKNLKFISADFKSTFSSFVETVVIQYSGDKGELLML